MEINRTSTCWGTTEDGMVESYRFGVGKYKLIHKVSVDFVSQSPTELHRLSWHLTGINKIAQDQLLYTEETLELKWSFNY